ncbi:WXG100 family type VII secretion target [uncultured Jatrophihabitans sp.]|uniref:WXG100 family type VII secretion target n=1 Tax=uncultured Jatrophihabitans sp. TaxID=1610747 RepID=UPI0035CBDD13
MTRVAVDLARLRELTDRMATFEHRLTRAHDDVLLRVEQVHATWQGDAANAQAAAQHEWTVALGEVHAALTALRQIGATAHANYAAAITTNRRMWAQ